MGTIYIKSQYILDKFNMLDFKQFDDEDYGVGEDIVIAMNKIIDDQENARNLSRFTKRLVNRDVLSVNGINVYDILRKEHLVITATALKQLEERLQWKVIMISSAVQ